MKIKQIANNVAKILSKMHGVSAKPHDIEDDGDKGGFEIELDGVKYDGGSYYVNNGEVWLASVSPQIMIGKTTDPLTTFVAGLKKSLKKIKKESVMEIENKLRKIIREEIRNVINELKWKKGDTVTVDDVNGRKKNRCN